MTEPAFGNVPRVWLVYVEQADDMSDDWAWGCKAPYRYEDRHVDCMGEHRTASRAEAESAAIQHLAEVHNIHPDGKAADVQQ